ncbi:MAG: NADH-quinone oxidoreductase subunit NuoE [Planctomycetota bacterium]
MSRRRAAPFPPGLVARIEELWRRYPHRQAALLPALHLIQRERGGWLSDGTIRDTAELFGVPDAHVKGMVGFYDMLHGDPVGRHVVRLCKTLSCKLRGADGIRAHIENKYAVPRGGTTEDGRFTFMCFECLGHCEVAPMMLVDEHRHTELTVEKVDRVLEALD